MEMNYIYFIPGDLQRHIITSETLLSAGKMSHCAFMTLTQDFNTKGVGDQS